MQPIANPTVETTPDGVYIYWSNHPKQILHVRIFAGGRLEKEMDLTLSETKQLRNLLTQDLVGI